MMNAEKVEKVEKGLAFCNSRAVCSKCNYRLTEESEKTCDDILHADALSVICELKAEIEQLKVDRGILSRYINYHNCNTCDRVCEYRPRPGERVRANCFRWIPVENTVNIPTGKAGEQK